MIFVCLIYVRKMILLLFQAVLVVPMLLVSDMHKKMDLGLRDILQIGKPMVEVQDQDEINKWQKSAIMLFAFGTIKAQVHGQ